MVNDLLAYVSFLFICFLLYVVVYGRIRIRRAVDFVVVLGAGHLQGRRVPPLGAPRDRILLAGQSRTTWENLTYSKELMCARRADYRCVIGSPTAWYFWPSATIREFIAVFLEHRVPNFTVCGLIVVSRFLTGSTSLWISMQSGRYRSHFA